MTSNNISNVLKQITKSLAEFREDIKDMHGKLDNCIDTQQTLNDITIKLDILTVAAGINHNTSTQIDEKFSLNVPVSENKTKNDIPKHLKNIATFIKYYYINHKDKLIENNIFTLDDEKSIIETYADDIAKKKKAEDKLKFTGGKIYTDIIKKTSEKLKNLETFKKNEKTDYETNNIQILAPDGSA